MHAYFDSLRPHLFGHRGASGEAPENTLPAFERAWSQGVRYLEMDCHATRDGEIVICHDSDVDRMTDGTGPVREHDFQQLRDLDAGHGFSPDGGDTFPFRGRGVQIPRLVDVLERFPEARINLEIKQEEPGIAAEVLRLIRRAGASERVLLAAELDSVMDQIHAEKPDTAIGSSLADAVAFYTAIAEGRVDGFAPRGHALQIPRWFDGNDLITPEALSAARGVGLFVHVWTINDPEEIELLLGRGVDGLMSDFPARLLR